ncbi:hypothetical protein GX411_10390 [Candidatus Fermentibacteria bacterium]|nr:hypothetical protein [Candidatus Fermentibacteria bacterium]
MSRPAATLAAVIIAGTITRAAALLAMDGILPLGWLYVDEHTYTAGTGADPFEKPPGTALLAGPLVAVAGPVAARAVFSAFTLLPAVLLSRRATGRWSSLAALLASFDPFLVYAGMQILPEAPAAALAAAAVAAMPRDASSARAGSRTALSGVALGASCLFRAELALLAPASLLYRPGRRWFLFAAGLAAPLAAAVLFHACGGGGIPAATNASENAWLGTRIELLRTPPGVEFEALVGMDPGAGDTFLSRAADSVLSDPGGTALFALRKALAGVAVPGEGRNLDDPWLMRRTGLLYLLPVSAVALVIGLAGSFRGSAGGACWLTRAAFPALLASSALFFPALRYRTALMPLFWDAASRAPARRNLRFLCASALVLTAASVTGIDAARPGLAYVARAGEEIDHGLPLEALATLDSARARGFRGADLHNLGGIALAVTGRREEALRELLLAQEMAPGSPSVWRNSAVLYHEMGMTGEAQTAARRAVSLYPGLEPLLSPLTGGGGDGPR